MKIPKLQVGKIVNNSSQKDGELKSRTKIMSKDMSMDYEQNIGDEAEARV